MIRIFGDSLYLPSLSPTCFIGLFGRPLGASWKMRSFTIEFFIVWANSSVLWIRSSREDGISGSSLYINVPISCRVSPAKAHFFKTVSAILKFRRQIYTKINTSCNHNSYISELEMLWKFINIGFRVNFSDIIQLGRGPLFLDLWPLHPHKVISITTKRYYDAIMYVEASKRSGKLRPWSIGINLKPVFSLRTRILPSLRSQFSIRRSNMAIFRTSLI